MMIFAGKREHITEPIPEFSPREFLLPLVETLSAFQVGDARDGGRVLVTCLRQESMAILVITAAVLAAEKWPGWGTSPQRLIAASSFLCFICDAKTP